VARTIDVTSSAVAVSGAVVTITPPGDFAGLQGYYVEIDAGAILDLADNAFPGITGATTWSFTTREIPTSVGVPFTNFEEGLDPWTPNSVSSTGLYIHQTQLQPSDDTTTNFATSGTRAASLGKSGGTITSPTLDLSGGGASETLTINLDYVWHNGTTTRRCFVEVSFDGGGTWFGLANIQTGGDVSNKVSYFGTVTITEGVSGANLSGGTFKSSNVPNLYNGTAFTNNTLVRVRNSASAGADARIFIDNIEVASSIEPPISGTPFDDWADGFTGLTDPNPALDFDDGGLATALEWVLGGDPTDASDDATIIPTIDNTSDPDGKLLFTFRRNVDAAEDENTTIIVEYGTDLAGWTAVGHEGFGPDDITVTEEDDAYATGIDRVTVALPSSLATTGKLFVRLNVTVATP